ncbi:MAG TPA: UDP-N-acetylglucosamine pyrophosphorylase [Nannocystaceae bacterium]|nr:UDP-N-acetylglucosamine pyrophosphorylase [Nannocystaceae bacterium]
MHSDALERRLAELSARGVVLVDPRQTYVAADVVHERVAAGAVLHPGTRLSGPRTFVGPGAQVGAEGPATLVDAVLGPDAVVDSGFVHGAVLLAGARLGSNAHVRPGTLLEESASTAHAVGLKHTILLGFVTLGSLINFCDVLMAGGTSRRDHSEVGSGFIHFNFTPWGRSGDKATPSLVGDVVHGVFLRRARIFLGGAGGMIGPRRVGYGAVAAAGQVIRRDVADDVLVAQAAPTIAKPLARYWLDRDEPRAAKNLEYIAQLVALRTWYRAVRLARVAEGEVGAIDRVLVESAIVTLDACIDERVTRLRSFLVERGRPMPALVLDPDIACPLPVAPSTVPGDHVAWVQSLSDDLIAAGIAWLRAVTEAVRSI